MTTGWTDDRRAECLRLWLDGKTAGEIVDALGGLTRNAVIGVINRAGLARNPLNGAPRPAARPRPARSKVGRHIDGRPDSDVANGAAMIIPEPPDADTPGLILSDMPSRGACKWPMSGAGAEMVMCARWCEGVYCVTHSAVAYVTISSGQRARDKSLAGWASRR